MEDLTQKAEALLDLQGYETCREQLADTVEEPPRRRFYREDRSQKDLLMNVEERLRISKNRYKSKLPPLYSSAGAPMSTSDLITAVESGGLDLNNPSEIESVPYCRVCMDYNHQISKYMQIKDLKESMRTRNRSFNRWRH